MPEQLPPNRPVSGNVAQLDQALWRELADATSPEEFCRAWLGLQSRMIGGVSGGTVVLLDAESGDAKPVAAWPRGYDGENLDAIVRRVFRERKGVVIRGEPTSEAQATEGPRFQVAYPISIGRHVHGVAALQINPRPQAELQFAMRQLQWGAAWLQNWVLRQTTAPVAEAAGKLTTAMELAARAVEEPRFKAAATAVVTELASRFNCDRVSVGFQVRGQVRVSALSHSAQFGKQMNLIRSIASAIGESVDQQTALVWPEPPEGGRHVLHAHEQLARNHGDGAICTVPFVDHEGHAFGALTLERSVSDEFDPETVELCDSVASLLGPVLEEKRKNDRLLVIKMLDSLRIQAQRLFGPRYALRKLVAGLLVGLVVFFIFAKGTYRVTAESTLEGEVRRVISAPFRGFIYDAQVRGGDIVRKGQVICDLDVRDLRLEYSRWSSEREQYVAEHRRAMSEGDRAAMNVLSKKMNQAEAQIALLDDQISRARIVAPFDGLVVSGDLSQALGSPVDTGQVLFEVAPLDSYRVTFRVDEKEIGEIETGQRGQLVLTAMPGEQLSFTVTKVTPVSVSEEGTNYFAVEGALDQISERLRPGMEGFGKIEIDRRRLIWIWTHDLIDWIRLKAWRWLP
jgi:biotin carboxyl carrier protein